MVSKLLDKRYGQSKAVADCAFRDAPEPVPVDVNKANMETFHCSSIWTNMDAALLVLACL